MNTLLKTTLAIKLETISSIKLKKEEVIRVLKIFNLGMTLIMKIKWTLSPYLMWARIASNASHGKWSPVPTRAENIMPRICASTATTAAAAQKKHGPANTVRSSTTRRDFARTVIFQDTTAPERSKRSAKNKKPPSSEKICPMPSSKTKFKPKPLQLMT